jgi:hypothetical protein
MIIAPFQSCNKFLTIGNDLGEGGRRTAQFLQVMGVAAAALEKGIALCQEFHFLVFPFGISPVEPLNDATPPLSREES